MSMTTPLLKTKLFVPKPGTGIVKRTRIVEKMNEGLDHNLILVLAPAGFGKSTIVSEWAASRTTKTTWLSIDEADNDLKRFFSYLIIAVQQIDESLGQDVLPVLQASDYPQTEHLLTLFINDLAEIDEDISLVLDDYHLIQNNDIHEGTQFLIEHAPPTFHLVISSRVSPPLPLARLRARGQVTEIRSQDLRFNLDESQVHVSDFFRSAVQDALISEPSFQRSGSILVPGQRHALKPLRPAVFQMTLNADHVSFKCTFPNLRLTSTFHDHLRVGKIDHPSSTVRQGHLCFFLPVDSLINRSRLASSRRSLLLSLITARVITVLVIMMDLLTSNYAVSAFR